MLFVTSEKAVFMQPANSPYNIIKIRLFFMKHLLSVLLLTIPMLSQAQKVKTFTGSIDGGQGTYQYYEDEDYKRVYHGRYMCNNEKLGRFVEGNFINDKRNGMWHFRYTAGGNNIKVTDVYKTYVSGKLNGPCSYNKVDKNTNKLLSSSVAKFVNNVQVGEFTSISTNDALSGTTSIECNFNENGLFEGKVHIIYKPLNEPSKVLEDIIVYENGFLKSRLYRNTVTGQVFVNSKRDSLVNYVKSCFYDGKDICRVHFVSYKAPSQEIKAYWPYASVFSTDKIGYRENYNLNLGKFLYCGDVVPSEGSYFSNVDFLCKRFSATFTEDPSYPGSVRRLLEYWHEECEISYDSFSLKPSYCRGVEMSLFAPEFIVFTNTRMD